MGGEAETKNWLMIWTASTDVEWAERLEVHFSPLVRSGILGKVWKKGGAGLEAMDDLKTAFKKACLILIGYSSEVESDEREVNEMKWLTAQIVEGVPMKKLLVRDASWDLVPELQKIEHLLEISACALNSPDWGSEDAACTAVVSAAKALLLQQFPKDGSPNKFNIPPFADQTPWMTTAREISEFQKPLADFYGLTVPEVIAFWDGSIFGTGETGIAVSEQKLVACTPSQKIEWKPEEYDRGKWKWNPAEGALIYGEEFILSTTANNDEIEKIKDFLQALS